MHSKSTYISCKVSRGNHSRLYWRKIRQSRQLLGAFTFTPCSSNQASSWLPAKGFASGTLEGKSSSSHPSPSLQSWNKVTLGSSGNLSSIDDLAFQHTVDKLTNTHFWDTHVAMFIYTNKMIRTEKLFWVFRWGNTVILSNSNSLL